MIRWTFDLVWALGYFVLALCSWLVEFTRCVLLFIVVVPVLIGRVALAASDVLIERITDRLFFRRQRR